MKVLVIGANGFLGRNLVKKALKMDWEADCVYHMDKSFIPSQCGIFHIDELHKLKSSYDVVFLLSAFIPYGSYNVADQRLVDVNIKIPLTVLDKFRKSKIVYSSSAAVYGDHNSTIFEDSTFNNPSLYGLSKLAAESILKFHPDFQIIRFSSIYGMGMTVKTFIPKLLEQAKRNKKIILFGTGARLQNYVYIDDAVDYLISVVSQKNSGIYLGVGERSYSNTEVARVVQSFVPGCKIQYIGKDGSPSFVYDNPSTRKILKFKPRFLLEEGIRSMLNG